MSSSIDDVRQTAAEVRKLTAQRNEAIRSARSIGWSLRKIATAAELSHTAVAKICAER